VHVAKVEVITLGLLADGPAYGYELLERARARGMALWSDVSRASIYQALRRLHGEGLLAAKSQAGREGPDRRVYRLERAGRDALRRGLVERFGDDDPDEAALALGFVHTLGAADARRGVAVREEAVRDRLSAISGERARVAAHAGSSSAVAVRMLDREEARTKADLAWLAAFKRGLGRLSK